MKMTQLARWVGGILLAAGLFASNGSAIAQSGQIAPAEPAVMLHDQTDHAGTNTIDSSYWQGHLNSISSQAADDFVIPNSEIWKITSVTAIGTIVGSSGSGVIDLLVRFYGNTGAGLPGALVYENPISSGSIGGLGTGHFVVSLPATLTLGPGHYWFSAQGRQSCSATDGSCQHWSWTERTIRANAESAWQSPGGTYGPNCIAWEPRVTVCQQPGGSTGPDLLFRLDGIVIPVVARVMLPVISR